MLYGCCVNMVTQTEDISGSDITPLLKNLGYDYAELSLVHLCAMSDESFTSFMKELKDTGLPVYACNNFFPHDIKLTGFDINEDKINDYLDKAFDRANATGTDIIVFGSGGSRMVPDGFPHSKALEQLAELLERISGYAIRYGITIAIEPLRKEECNIINNYQEAFQLAKMTDRPNINCLLDYYHLTEEKENVAIIDTSDNKLAHVHFAEPAGRVYPENIYQFKYREFISSLLSAGYDKTLSIEAYSKNFYQDAEIALRLLKGIENELKDYNQ